MISYIYYNNKTGEINSTHLMETNKDILTKDRQIEMLKMMFGTSSEYYNMSILVSEGYNQVFFPDVMTKINGTDVIDLNKLKKIREKIN